MPTPPPVRYPSGVSTDAPYQPLAQYGLPNPMDYHTFFDPFDYSLNVTGMYTKTGTGTALVVAGDGGNATLTTTGAATDLIQIQLPVGTFTAPLGLPSGKKAFFATRVTFTNATNPGFVAGLMAVGANAYTTPADGIYFYKAATTGILSLNTAIGGVVTVNPIPPAAYNLANATRIDLAFYIDRNLNIQVFVGAQLYGWLPQSGTGPVNAQGVSILPPNGPVASIPNASLTAANLSPTVAITSGVAAPAIASVGFLFAAKEN